MSVSHAGALSREQIFSLLDGEQPLVSGLIDAESQVQPNGIDLTVREVSRHRGQGAIGVDSADRVLPELEPLAFDAGGWLDLAPGIYHIMYNEVVSIPTTLMALGRPRSSLARCGVGIVTAVWDAGYQGRSTSLLVVHNPAGFRIQRDSRVMQLVFFGMSEAPADGYRGRYQRENL